MLLKIESNAPVMESVSTYVPATRATPRMIASAVRVARSRRDANPLSATRNTAGRSARSGERLHGVDDLGLAGAAHLPDDPPVGQEQDAVGDRGGAGVVRDHDDRLADRVDRTAQQGQDLVAGCGVEVAGRLVGEQDGGPAEQGPGDGHPLLL